jgi:hypothetical protein
MPNFGGMAYGKSKKSNNSGYGKAMKSAKNKSKKGSGTFNNATATVNYKAGPYKKNA